MEKGYRYFGTDLTAGDTPYEAGLGFCVAPARRASSAATRCAPPLSRRCGSERCSSAARTT